ncbi:MAG: hypothetical protein Q8L34_01715 [Candidatus Woesearchaeota archaeon]|nr:hypothetical protein [Candidatus Woesearchaeota archaeon]
MKRGQMEMVGLLVIVILLLVLGVLFLKFSVTPKSTTLADSRSSLESTRLLQALVLTTIQGKSFQEYAVACSEDSAACTVLRQEIENIFTILLKKGQKYSFYLLYNDQNILRLEQCTLGVVSSYPFTAIGGFYEVQLRLCS